MATRTRKKKTAPKKSAARKRSATAAPKIVHERRFPGESPGYRKARDELLQAEIALRRQVEAVAAQRRALPPGGIVKEDYLFGVTANVGDLARMRMSELFSPGKNVLVLYNFMYGPNMDRPCPMCTSMLDSLDGNAHHISQRINLGVVAKSPLPRIMAFARERGWRRLKLLSSGGNSYNHDYHGETEDGRQMPMLNVFVKEGSRIRHCWGSELMFVPSDKGQDGRHVDFMWPLWNVLDTTPEGRGADWRPKLNY
jgi:predicted dithiol-disulfide oxidoreductase (DUF899 family)